MSKRSLFPVMLALGLIVAGPALAQSSDVARTAPFEDAVERARALDPLRTLMVAQSGDVVVDEGFRGHSTDRPANVKSVSKTILSALVGIAIDKGILEGTEQKIAPLLRDKLPDDADPRLEDITIGHLLSMQAGLERTSGPNYGAWVTSRDWVAAALARPFAADPGGPMLYSTGSSHLLSAILTRESGRSTLALAREWLGEPADVHIAAWDRDPQGIYFGGNQMALTPRSLLAFGELYRNGGMADGKQVVPREWIERSWTPRTQSRFTGDDYGYGWFMRELGGYPAYYGWGYGGQMIYVLPDLELTVAITSDLDRPAGRSGYRDELHRLVAETVVPAAAARLGHDGPNAVMP